MTLEFSRALGLTYKFVKIGIIMKPEFRKYVALIIIFFAVISSAFADSCSSLSMYKLGKYTEKFSGKYNVNDVLSFSREMRWTLEKCHNEYKVQNDDTLKEKLNDSYRKFGSLIEIAEEYQQVVLGTTVNGLSDIFQDKGASGLGHLLIGATKERAYIKEMKNRLLTSVKSLIKAIHHVQRNY